MTLKAVRKMDWDHYKYIASPENTSSNKEILLFQTRLLLRILDVLHEIMED